MHVEGIAGEPAARNMGVVVDFRLQENAFQADNDWLGLVQSLRGENVREVRPGFRIYDRGAARIDGNVVRFPCAIVVVDKGCHAIDPNVVA